jgi:hypothetical protein
MSENKIRQASKSSLPEAVNLLDDDIFSELFLKLQRARALRAEISEREEELKEIQEELALTCVGYGMDKGFRAGLIGYEYHGWITRKTLNKELLLENGVTADQIEASYKDSAPFLSAKFIDFDVL